MVDDEVATAAENSLPSASKGLPPPLCPALSVGLLLSLDDGQLAGILGASKICDDSVTVVMEAVSLVPAEEVLEAESVGSGDELVSTARLVGTSVELAVLVLLTIVVVGCLVGASWLVGVAVDECCDCKTSSALVHSPCGPLPFKKTASTLDLSSRSRSPSLPQASLMRSVIESRPLTHLTLHPFWVKSDGSQFGMLCL